jgi:hypothetical protein
MNKEILICPLGILKLCQHFKQQIAEKKRNIIKLKHNEIHTMNISKPTQIKVSYSMRLPSTNGNGSHNQLINKLRGMNFTQGDISAKIYISEQINAKQIECTGKI